MAKVRDVLIIGNGKEKHNIIHTMGGFSDLDVLKEDALPQFRSWLKEKGYEGQIVILAVEEHVGTVDVQCIRPYGLYIIKSDGTVIDNYGTFNNPRYCNECHNILNESESGLCESCIRTPEWWKASVNPEGFDANDKQHVKKMFSEET